MGGRAGAAVCLDAELPPKKPPLEDEPDDEDDPISLCYVSKMYLLFLGIF